MTAPPCPNCGQPLPADPVLAEADKIRDWCRENSVRVVAGHLLRLEGVAEMLGCTASTVNRKISAGDLQAKMFLGKRHVELAEIARLIFESGNSLKQTRAE